MDSTVDNTSAVPTLVDSSLEVDNRVAVLTLRRNDVRNALTGTALIDDIVRTVQWVNNEAAVSVLIITGDGAAFSSGGNIKEMQAQSGSFAGSPVAIQDHYRRGIQQIPLALAKAEVVTPEALMPRARELAGQMAAKPPLTLRLTKRMMKLAQRSDLPDFLDLCACFQTMAHHTTDHLEAVNAFLGKREPFYMGK